MARRAFIALVVFALTFVGSPFGPRSATASSPDVVISQIYGAGGNSGAVYRNDYVELFNRGTSPVSLEGKSVQYASATGSGNFGSNAITSLAGTLAPGAYALVQLAGGSVGSVLPTPDVTGTVNMAAGAGKVALVSGTAGLACNGSTTPCTAAQLSLILDIVGYGNANFYEATAAPAPSTILAVFRKNAGCSDTDNNGADFMVATPSPRNSASPRHFCSAEEAPTVSATSPASNAANIALDSNLAITFSENVNVVADWFAISCASSGAHSAAVTMVTASTYLLDPAIDFALDETCTVTVYASRVTDQDLLDPPDAMDANYVFSFSTLAPATAIHDIQGAAHTSPMNGAVVKNATGIVTAKRTTGFYMQDPGADNDLATSEAIFVFTGAAPSVSVGDAVHVRGTVTEFRPGGAATNLSTTELSDVSVTAYSSANALPAPVVIGVDRTPPTQIIEDDANGDVETSGVFDPANDGIDFWESLEAMLVQVPDPVIVGPSNSYNEIPVLANDGAGATTRTARGGIAIAANDYNPERIIVDDEVLKASGGTFPAHLSVGDHFAGSVTGVVDYDFGNFMLELTSSPTATAGGLAREITAAPAAGELTVATFNVENLSPTDPQSKFATLAQLIVTNLRSPDVISLEEVQDDSGATNDGTVGATTTLTKLASAISAVGGPTYQWREIDPVNDMDGGAPGGNIRQVFFFRTDRGLAFVDRGAAGSTTANSVVDTNGAPELAYSPGRIDPTNTAFSSSRKPLAGEFTYDGHRVFVIANHWNSKGGDQPLVGRYQPPVLSSETQRVQQAAIVASFVDDILSIDANASVVVLGDLNDFEFSAPLVTLKAAGLHDLIETLPANERYSYVYEGNSETLDHILVSDALLPVAVDDVVHVNAEFWDQASDHDPQIVRLLLPDLAGLCRTTRDVVASSGIASSLCAKLTAARASLARDAGEAFAGQIAAYVNEVEAQRGKTMSEADATRLIGVAKLF